MRKRTLSSFADELNKIASAGFLHNVGPKIVTWTGKRMQGIAQGVGGWAAKQPGNLGRAGLAHLNPLQGMKEGLKFNLDPATGGGMIGRTMFLGGTALTGASVVPKEDPTGKGESRTTRAARFVGTTATGLIASKHGVLPSLAFGVGGDVAGGYAGRAIDRLRGKPPPKPVLKVPPPVSAPVSQEP